jgi:hypothetical protein
MGTGTSAAQDSRSAGSIAASTALAGRTDAALLVVFCNLRHDLASVLTGIREVAGEIPLIGCSTAGELTAAGPTDRDVVVTALGGPGVRVATRAVPGLSADQRLAGARAAEAMTGLGDDGNPLLMVFGDGQVSRQEEMLRGAYGVLGAAVPLVGGFAGDSVNLSKTYLLFGDEVLTDAVVSAAIRTDGEFGIGVAHGYRQVGDALRVTRSVDSRVSELDDRPALDVYLERLGAPAAAYGDPAMFAAFALGHPLGISRRSGTEMRFIKGADFSERTLLTLADVPQGGTAWLMSGDAEDLLDAAMTAREQALANLGGPAAGLMVFDCIARRTVLGEQGLVTEVDRFSLDGLPLAGFYSHGEIARVRGINGFHNQTAVVLAIR